MWYGVARVLPSVKPVQLEDAITPDRGLRVVLLVCPDNDFVAASSADG